MSTKGTVIAGEGYHLYEECFDDSGIWLSVNMPGVEFACDHNGRLTLRLPFSVWDVIRHHTNDWVQELRGLSDEEVAAKVRARKADWDRTNKGTCFEALPSMSIDDQIADAIKLRDATRICSGERGED